MNVSMNRKSTDRQSGMVSIMITMIMIIVISLIVLGFGEVTRRNQREALNNQLGTTAFYAAESGVNDALDAYNQNKNNVKTNLQGNASYYNTCGSSGGGAHDFITDANLSFTLNPTTNVSYSCITLTDQPTQIVGSVPLGNNVVYPIKPSTATPLTVSWAVNGASGTSGCPASEPYFTPSDATKWQCGYGVLRFDLYKDTGAYDAGTMASNTVSVFLVPSSSGSASGKTLTFNDPNMQAYVIPVSCTATCSYTFTQSFSGTYYIRLTSIYLGADTVMINGNPGVTFSGAELVVDATGRAEDQRQRIEEHVRLTAGQQGTPVNALSSAAPFCKRFTIANVSPYTDGNTGDSGNGACTYGGINP